MELTESAWARVLRLGADPASDRDSLAAELATLDLAGGAGGGGEGGEDVHALLRLAQELLRYRHQQVNSLISEMGALRRESSSKRRKKTPIEDSPSRSNDSYLETITQQEEEIRANKEILDQLYTDIAELEGRKQELRQSDIIQLDRDSNSSREPLSELDAVRQLEGQLAAKNKHIRKMLSDIKVLEEENRLLKHRTSIVKEKLSEATHLIDKLTEQLLKSRKDWSALKETIGKAEEEKQQLTIEIDALKKKLNQRDSTKMEKSEEIQETLLYWKKNARSRKHENENLLKEIEQIKAIKQSGEDHTNLSNIIQQQEEQIRHLQEKLSEASDEILDSVRLIELLKADNNRVKTLAVDSADATSIVSKSDTEDRKDVTILKKMKRKIHHLTTSLNIAEETMALKEQELAELSSQLLLLGSGDEGVQALLDSLKSKRRQLKLKDVGIKSLVQEVNTLSQVVDGLQLENEAMREKLHIGPDEVIATKGVLAKFKNCENKAIIFEKKLREMENAYVNLELECRQKEKTMTKLKDGLRKSGMSEHTLETLICTSDSECDVMPEDGGGESSVVLARRKCSKQSEKSIPKISEEMKALIDENDGLRRGMEEILEYLKNSNISTSGTLAVQCPSLEKVVQSLDARHAAGWYAPHISAMMGLQAAIGGRDALLAALQQARKETFDVMNKLAKESEKSSNLELKLQSIENIVEKPQQSTYEETEINVIKNGVFGTWMSEKDLNQLDLINRENVNDMLASGNKVYETHLKEALTYFHKQFKSLYEKMTEIAIQSTNDQNKWAIEDENNKAEIANLKAQLATTNEDDPSEISEGVVTYPNTSVLARKCTYLEDSYRYIRTLYENIKNEFLENERQKIIMMADFESRIQLLIINIANLSDRLRNSVSIDLFLKQNEILNDINFKYRFLLDNNFRDNSFTMQVELEKQKNIIIEYLENMKDKDKINGDKTYHKNIQITTEFSITKLQLEHLCQQYDNATKRIEELDTKNIALQSSQRQLIDSTLPLASKQDYEVMQNQLEKLVVENRSLKEQCVHVGNQLEIALLQLQDTQQRQLMNDMELNMLRHQVLDLQATDDNKAIIARLSGEILVAHLQTSDISKKIDKLTAAIGKEKQRRIETEEMLEAREKIFNVYASRFEARFRYMFEVMQMLRLQYEGTIPMTSIENYLNIIEDLSRKNIAVDEKLTEVEDLRSILLAKTRVFNEIIENNRIECPTGEQECPHELKLAINQSVHIREIDHYKKKIDVLEQSREELAKRCSSLEITLILVNQGFNKAPLDNVADQNNMKLEEEVMPLEVEDMPSDDDYDESRKSQTITLPKPHILKSREPSLDGPYRTNIESRHVTDLPGSPIKISAEKNQSKESSTALVQTDAINITMDVKMVQTDSDVNINRLKKEIKSLRQEREVKDQELSAALELASQRADDRLTLEASKVSMDAQILSLKDDAQKKEAIIEKLKSDIEAFKQEINSLKYEDNIEQKRKKDSANQEIKSLLQAVKKLENDKNVVIEEYKEMLKNERDEYSYSIKECQAKIDELQEKLDLHSLQPASEKDDTNPIVTKFSETVTTLEDKTFKLQNALDDCKTDLKSCEKELERWKALAAGRLTKIEQMSETFEERHSHEVESYRTENQHWLSEMTENQKQILDLRSRLAEQRTLFLKQLSEKDAHIEQHKSAIQNLKSQILNMQSMMTASDPSFDLSAIAEVSETSDGSPQDFDRLEIRFHSTHDLGEQGEDYKEPSVVSPTWQETIVDRLRREKQVVGKQNSLLRRQIKALAGRERRSRLEAQNIKMQMYRLSSSGSKVSSAEAATLSLHNKLAALQSQLSSARRDNHAATVTAWDKWKRAQQVAERWQAKYEEKCQELKKCESSLNFAKTAVARLEREKRVLLTRLGEIRSEKQLTFAKDMEEMRSSAPEKEFETHRSEVSRLPPHITVQSLLDRIEAQQRRIVALELADKGHGPLVTEYEKVLSQNTLLKGQVLKLESQVLESQLAAGQRGLDQDSARMSELGHLRSYCETLKQENIQLSAKVCSLSSVEGGSHLTAAQRINDLEQTVLTLRGLVSKLQSEQKKTSARRVELARPASGHSASEQERTQLELSRVEVGNLRRCLAEKDLLLERSRDLLKMAAEREVELLKENDFLRQCIHGTANS